VGYHLVINNFWYFLMATRCSNRGSINIIVYWFLYLLEKLIAKIFLLCFAYQYLLYEQNVRDKAHRLSSCQEEWKVKLLDICHSFNTEASHFLQIQVLLWLWLIIAFGCPYDRHSLSDWQRVTLETSASLGLWGRNLALVPLFGAKIKF